MWPELLYSKTLCYTVKQVKESLVAPSSGMKQYFPSLFAETSISTAQGFWDI